MIPKKRLLVFLFICLGLSSISMHLIVRQVTNYYLNGIKDSLSRQAVFISRQHDNIERQETVHDLLLRDMFLITTSENNQIAMTSFDSEDKAKYIIGEINKAGKIDGSSTYVNINEQLEPYYIVRRDNIILGQSLAGLENLVFRLRLIYMLGLVFFISAIAYGYKLLERFQRLSKIKGVSEKTRVETILSNLADGIVVIDRIGKVTMINRAAETLLNMTREDVLGLCFTDVILNNCIKDHIHYAMTINSTYETNVVTDYSADRSLRLYSVPVVGFNGERDGILVVIQDMTKLRKLEQIRKDFVANVSHELRTPITSIKALAETLLEGALNDEEVAMKFLNTINNESDRLSRLIDDLLTLSQMESHSAALKLERFSYNLLINDMIMQLSPKATAYGVNIEVHFYTELILIADRDKIKQVLVNLIDNAIVYSGKGSTVKVSTSQVSPGFCQLSVEDNGIGIPADDQERIFERFYRVDKARSRQQGGTGLGLSIVKHIVELHHGNISVESKEGKGTKFTIMLPINQDKKV